MRSSHRYTIMHESPYMGWNVPYSWQEPEYNDDNDDSDLLDENFITTDMLPLIREDESDFDDEGLFTLR